MRRLEQLATALFLSLAFGSLGIAEEKPAPTLDDDWGVLLRAKIWKQEKLTERNGTEITTLKFSSTTEAAQDLETRRSGRSVQVTIEIIATMQTATNVNYSPLVLKHQGEIKRMEFSGDLRKLPSLSRRYQLEKGKLILSLATESKEREVVGEFLPVKE